MIEINTLESNYNNAFNKVIDNEGGYSNDPDDPGGETNFGITQKELDRWHKILNLPTHVKYLKIEDAKIFYKNLWDSYHYEDIDSPEIATKIFDLTVNLGPYQSHLIAQRAVNDCANYNIAVDGILGPNSMEAINALHVANKDAELHEHIREQAKKVYKQIIKAKPRLKKFEKGWLSRANQ